MAGIAGWAHRAFADYRPGQSPGVVSSFRSETIREPLKDEESAVPVDSLS